MRTRAYRRPDKLPFLRGLPKIGDLLAIQDLDGTIFPVIVLGIIYAQTKKGKNTKKVVAIDVLSGNIICNCSLHDLKLIE